MASRILVVDDSATIRRVVGAILERNGYQVTVAADGQAAFDLLVAEPREVFDLVLVDFVMPKMNGFQLCRMIRQRAEIAALPVVLMSAKSDKIRDQFVQQTGALDAISKPFDAQALVAVIDHALRRVETGRASAAHLPELDEEEALAPSAGAPTRATGGPVLTGEFGMLPLGAILQLLQVEGQSGELDVSNGTSEVTLTLRGGLVDLVQSRGTTDEFRLGRYFVEEGLVTKTELAELLTKERPKGESVPPMSGKFDRSAAKTFPFERDATRKELEPAAPVSVTSDTSPEGIHAADVEPETMRLAADEAEALIRKAEADAVSSGTLSPTDPEGVPAAPRLLGDRLLAAGRINEEQLRAALVRQSSELVYELLRWQKGTFEFRRKPASPAAAAAKLGLTVPAVVMEGFRRVDEWRGLESAVGDFEGVLGQDAFAIAAIPADKLTAKERTVLDAVDGQRTLREVIAASHMSSFDACRVLAELLSARVVRRIAG